MQINLGQTIRMCNRGLYSFRNHYAFDTFAGQLLIYGFTKINVLTTDMRALTHTGPLNAPAIIEAY